MEFQRSLRQPHVSPAPARDPSLLVAHAQPSMRHFIGADQHLRPRPRELARQEHLKSGGLRADMSEKEIDGETEGDELFSTFVDPAHASITSLDLASNPLGDTGVLKLTDALRTHPALTELHLECTECGDLGASALAQQLAVDAPPELPHANRPPPFALSPLPPPPPGDANIFGRTLRQLFLNNNSIADQGARALATALSFNSTVTELYLGFNRIADQGAIDLAYMLSIRNGTLNVLHLWRNPFGESVEKGNGESPGYTAVREALAINTTLTSYDGPAGPLLNATVRQTNRTAYLRMRSIKDEDKMLRMEDWVRGKEREMDGLRQDIVNLKLGFQQRELELEDAFQERLRIRELELDELHRQDLAHMKAKWDQIQIEALEFQENTLSAALKRQIRVSLEEQERKLEEDFAAYLKKREMALESKFKASAKLFEEEQRAELLAIKTRHIDEVARMVDDAQCL